MKAIFYFDYSDYRSYLMMRALDGLKDLALDIQWCSVDAYSLRAMSGCAVSVQSPMERDYLRQEAERFARMHDIDFIWQPDPIHSGTALSAGIWFMTQAPDAFETYARCVLENIWAHGNFPDAACIRGIFESLDISPDAFFKTMTERECFQFQDAFLQDALSVGVYDVPALVIGDAIFLRYDQIDVIRLTAIEQWLKNLPAEAIVKTTAMLLYRLPLDEFVKRFSDLLHTQTRNSPPMRHIAKHTATQFQISLPVPKAQYRFAINDIPNPIPCISRIIHDTNELIEVLQTSKPGFIYICDSKNLSLKELDIQGVKFDNIGDRIFFIRIQKNDIIDEHPPAKCNSAIVCIRIGAADMRHIDLCDDADDRTCVIETFGDATFAMLSSNGSRDLLTARLANFRGAQFILRFAHDSNIPISEAVGCMTSSWVFEFSSNGIDLIDAYAHRKKLQNGDEFILDNMRRQNASSWCAPAPRTLLLLEKALTFGDIDAHADIELACRGRDLTIVTANQESNISHARDYVSLRVAEHTVDIIPIGSDEIYAFETLFYRTICTINRAPKNSYPICVNYWAHLEYDMLDAIRPIHAAITARLHIPVLLVVANQLVEIWLAPNTGTPYRIGKDDDAFQVDFADLVSTDDLPDKILNTLEISPLTLNRRLEWLVQAQKLRS